VAFLCVHSRIKLHCVSGIVVYQSATATVHCINPDCPRPSSQPWGNKFCSGCGCSLQLNNRYIPLQYLGSGGFATIYSVWDLQQNTQQVLKVLLDNSPKALQLFEQEAAVLARLQHPGVPRVDQDSYFVVRINNPKPRLLPCLVMEKITGQTLQDVLNQYPQGCSEADVWDWLEQAVDILGELHRCGIIHRDIKPSNLMLRQDTGQLVAIDFGGAKQLGFTPFGKQKSSTRLFSPGYSPPEQITGEQVGPTADFYALGRTMIQLLTGEDLEYLEDPDTSELLWQNQVNVSLSLADLLNDMVRSQPQQRPQNATEIKRRLAASTRIATRKYTRTPPSPTPIALFLDKSLEGLTAALTAFGQGVTDVVRFAFRVITGTLLACLDTTWEMTLGGIAAAIGAASGFALINWTVVGDRFTKWLIPQLPLILPHLQKTVWQEILLFAVTGLLTAWGLTLGGGFGQTRRPWIAGLMGIFGYSTGWIIWQALMTPHPHPLPARVLAWVIGVSVAPLVLGLGLPSHYLVHALVAAIGTGTVFGGLAWLKILPVQVLVNIFSGSNVSLSAFIDSAAFFCLLGVTLAFCLGISYYILVPILRWFGWR
jgi:hypothetical protein